MAMNKVPMETVVEPSSHMYATVLVTIMYPGTGVSSDKRAGAGPTPTY